MTMELIDENELIKQGKTVIGRICWKCKGNNTYVYKGHEIWYLDPNFNNEKRYLCNRCYRKTETPNKNEKLFKGRVCHLCGNSNTKLTSRGVPSWACYKDYNGEVVENKFICDSCKQKIIRNMPDSQSNIIKHMRNWRTGNLDKDSSAGKGFISESVVAKVICASNVNTDMNNFAMSYDLYHDIYGRINVKGKVLYYNMWMYDTEGKENCDTYFLLGYDNNRKNVESVYIIPNKDWVYDLVRMTIIRNPHPSRGSKYDQFKVDQKLYNDAYHSLMEFLKDKTSLGIDEIKRWLEIE